MALWDLWMRRLGLGWDDCIDDGHFVAFGYLFLVVFVCVEWNREHKMGHWIGYGYWDGREFPMMTYSDWMSFGTY